MKKLYLLPSDEPCRAQMIKYRGAKTTHEADDIIDSIRIAAELIRKPAAKEETKKRVRDMMRSRQRRVDRRTGILL